MGGYDFGVLWQAGRAIWQGQDPYGVSGFFCPLPVAYFFARLAALPRQVAFWVWLALHLVLLGWLVQRRAAPSALNALSRGNAPGLWSLERLFPGTWPALLVLAVIVFVWGLFQPWPVGWAAATLANPSGLFYDLLVLTETAPPWLLVPISWVAVGLFLWWRMLFPWLLVPLAVILCHRFRGPWRGEDVL
jgi:hypothetical protein